MSQQGKNFTITTQIEDKTFLTSSPTSEARFVCGCETFLSDPARALLGRSSAKSWTFSSLLCTRRQSAHSSYNNGDNLCIECIKYNRAIKAGRFMTCFQQAIWSRGEIKSGGVIAGCFPQCFRSPLRTTSLQWDREGKLWVPSGARKRSVEMRMGRMALGKEDKLSQSSNCFLARSLSSHTVFFLTIRKNQRRDVFIMKCSGLRESHNWIVNPATYGRCLWPKHIYVSWYRLLFLISRENYKQFIL